MKIIENIDDIQNTCNTHANKIFEYTPQLFYIENEKSPIRPLALGSCILYVNKDQYYIITAKHVFYDHQEKKIGMMVNDIFFLIESIMIFSNDKEDKIDLGFIKLNTNQIAEIKKQYKFLDDTLIETRAEVSNEFRYMMAGFPVSMTKIYGNTFQREEFILLTQPSKDDKYTKLEFNKESHIIVNINKPRSFNNPNFNSKLPKLYGISGSGLWYLSNDKSKFYLVAIMTEWHKDDNVTIGTKSSVVMDLVKNFVDIEYDKQIKLLEQELLKINPQAL
jgi:hypothetical protein